MMISNKYYIVAGFEYTNDVCDPLQRYCKVTRKQL